MFEKGTSYRGSDSGNSYVEKEKCPHGSTKPWTCKQCKENQTKQNLLPLIKIARQERKRLDGSN
jgi:hypothetical protein